MQNYAKKLKYPNSFSFNIQIIEKIREKTKFMAKFSSKFRYYPYLCS